MALFCTVFVDSVWVAGGVWCLMVVVMVTVLVIVCFLMLVVLCCGSLSVVVGFSLFVIVVWVVLWCGLDWLFWVAVM